jgi:hypothetical protein
MVHKKTDICILKLVSTDEDWGEPSDSSGSKNSRSRKEAKKKTRTECLDQRNGGKQCITLSRVGRGREHNVMNRLASQD